MIIHHGRKPSRASLAQFFFLVVSILVFNGFGLPSVVAATDCTAVAEIPPAECEALVNLYNSTGGPNWSDSATNNWNVTDTPCTDWAGVVCGGGYVTEINRYEKNLTGSIPDLSALTNLQALNLSINQLTGSIPNLSALTNLQSLGLSGNQLTGSIPNLSMLTNLQALDLFMNQLTGSIPNLSTLTNLQLLNLSSNQLTGSIPDLSTLTNLASLRLYYNQLTGSIPNLSMLTNLQALVLSGNHLTGSIPDWLNTLTNLQILGLNYNRLTGSIPDLSALTNLQTLWLSDNQLTGSIPTSLINLNILNELYLSYNQLTAQDPTLLIFLSSKNPDWAQTQTIPPTNLQATPLSENSIEISWTPILYTGDGGYYRVKYATTTGGPYTPAVTTTADKSATSYVVTDLSPNTTYYFVVETYTPAHSLQQNELTSELSTEVSATTHQSSTSPPITPPATPLPPITPTTPPATPLPPTMNLTINFGGTGHGSVTTDSTGIDCDSNQAKCSYSVDTATWIRLIPAATADSKFTGWSGWQSDCDNGEVFMSGLRSCTANFELLRFPLTVTTVGQGKVRSEPVGINCGDKCQHVFDIGTKVTLTAVPEKGWQFKEWKGDCDENGHTMIDSEKWCEVVFVQKNDSANKVVFLDEGINFNAQVVAPIGSDPYIYRWELGDSNISNEQTFFYYYHQTGIYPVILTVTDSQGNTVKADEFKVTVIQIKPILLVDSLVPEEELLDGIQINQHEIVNRPKDYYFSSTGEKISFQRLDNYVLVVNKPNATSVQFLDQFAQSSIDNPFGKGTLYRLTDKKTTVQAFTQSSQSRSIEYISPLLINEEGNLLAVSNRIILKRSATISENDFIQRVQNEGLRLVRKLRLSQDEYLFEMTSSYEDISAVFETTNLLYNKAFIQWAEPDFLVKLNLQEFWPNDNLFNEQWHLHNTGQNGAQVDADIDAPEGWEIARGEEIIIGINDDGVDLNHEDLVIWTNPHEIPNNNIDDDNNGYTDDIQGWDFGDGDNDPNPHNDQNSNDSDNHGTAVAGVAGAHGNNGQGVTGSAINASILPIRTDSMLCSDWGESLRYGAKQAHLVNHSWSTGFACQNEIDESIKEAVTGNLYGAIRGRLGTPMLFAAGNSASGWIKFRYWINTGSNQPVNIALRWRFSKNNKNSSEYDTVWLDDITIPNRPVINFENDTVGDIPTNFQSGGDANWHVVQENNSNYARGAVERSVRAGAIGDNQETHLDLQNVMVNHGDVIDYWIWVSSEQGDKNKNLSSGDFFTFWVSRDNGINWIEIENHRYAPGKPGGQHRNAVSYPASNPNTIAVGASNDGGLSGVEERSYYSQFGPQLDVVAPSSGGWQGIVTTDRRGTDGYSDNDYTGFGGTSAATPLASGVVAVMFSHNPLLTAEEMRDCLRKGADKIGHYPYTKDGLNPSSGTRNDFYGYGRVNLKNSLNCVQGAIKSVKNGAWLDPTVWEPIGIPSENDYVVIKKDHFITANSIKIKRLLIEQGGALQTASIQPLKIQAEGVFNHGKISNVGDIDVQKILEVTNNASLKGAYGYTLTVKANNIYNDGEILGADGKDASSLNHKATAGSVVSLTANDSIVNRGKIKAGRGGHDITHNYVQKESINAQGGKGGTIIIEADTIINKGTIGPEQKPVYQNGEIISDGGNGGIASNTTIVKHEGNCDANLTEPPANLGSEHKWNYGDATGGEGGKTSVTAGTRLENSGIIASGYGGDARIWWCTYHSERGKGGEVIALSKGQVMSHGVIKGGNGRILIEPEIMLSGGTMHLEDSKEIVIFGGDNWQLNLQRLSTNAITAEETITLAVGQGGIIDLRENNLLILKAGREVQIFADIILLDNGITLRDLIDVPNIQTHPSKILYEVVLSSTGVVTAEPSTIISVDIRVLNVGPTIDTYALSISDSADWQLGTLPNTITVEGLNLAELELEVTLPPIIEATDTITITATSLTDPTVSATTDITVTVRDDTKSFLQEPDDTLSGTVYDPSGAPVAGATLTGGDETLTTDENGHWQIDNNPALTSGTLYDAQGNPLAGATIQLGDQMLTTDAEGRWELTQPLVTGNDNPNIPATDLFSSLPPQTPTCYASGLIDWVCNANGQQLTNLTVGPNGMIAYGTLIGTLTNQGWVSNLTLEPHSRLTGGIVTGYITNHGEMADFEFRGAAIVGGTLAGEITNTSQIGGYFHDVQLAVGTHLSGGQLAGKISGDVQAPALLEHLEIQAGSHLQYVTIGDGVKLAAGITLGQGVQFTDPSNDPRLVPKPSPEPVACNTDLPSLGVTAINAAGQLIETQCQCAGGVSVNGGSFEPVVKVRLTDTVEIRGTVCVAPEQIGQLADLVVYLDYQPLDVAAEAKQHYMLDPGGEVLPWDGQVAHLVAFRQTMLTAVQEILLYHGSLATTGQLNLFLGYRLMDGTLISNEQALEITITDK